MKYDVLIYDILNEANGFTKALGTVAKAIPNQVATGIVNNQTGTVFNTLNKPGLEKKKDQNYVTIANDQNWDQVKSRLKPNTKIYVKFKNPAGKQNTNNQQPNPQSINQKPKDGDVVTLPSGDNIYDAKTDQWIIKGTNKPNPAPGQVLNAWKKQLLQNNKTNFNDKYPDIEVDLIIRTINNDNKTFVAEILDKNTFGVRQTTNPNSNITYTKIDFKKNANTNSPFVIMGKGTMEPSFGFRV